jgi:7-carboxy-7-deazaguanine synthase
MKNEADLFVIELFKSIQGETTFTGLVTTFLRLSGCNLRCSWCDTTYSLHEGEKKSIGEVLKEITKLGAKYVCITGGEPLLQAPVFGLMKTLTDRNFTVSLETNGSLSIENVDKRVHIILDVKCPSTGMSDKTHWQNLQMMCPKDEVKFVVADFKDFCFAKEVIKDHKLSEKGPQLLFSVVHGHLQPSELAKWILEESLPVRLQIQAHKYIWGPDQRGV